MRYDPAARQGEPTPAVGALLASLDIDASAASGPELPWPGGAPHSRVPPTSILCAAPGHYFDAARPAEPHFFYIVFFLAPAANRPTGS